MQNLGAYVAKGDGKQIRVNPSDGALDSQLKNLGFIFDSSLSAFVIQAETFQEKASLFARLRDMGVLFSDGREWCPAELFEYFRDQKLLDGTFKRVSWRNSQDFNIVEI